MLRFARKWFWTKMANYAHLCSKVQARRAQEMEEFALHSKQNGNIRDYLDAILDVENLLSEAQHWRDKRMVWSEKALLLAALLLMSACHQMVPTHLSFEEERAIKALQRAWEEKVGSTDGCYLDFTQVVYARDASEFERLCFPLPATDYNECMVQRTAQDGIRVQALPVVVIGPGRENKLGKLTRHGLVHWMSWCKFYNVDRGHKNELLWEHLSKDSVEGLSSDLML